MTWWLEGLSNAYVRTDFIHNSLLFFRYNSIAHVLTYAGGAHGRGGKLDNVCALLEHFHDAPADVLGLQDRVHPRVHCHGRQRRRPRKEEEKGTVRKCLVEEERGDLISSDEMRCGI